ncbi:MAG: homogentisate phytyltransferase [Hamadaea sp.]|nr:homogentisate phytyltransferase [Hamadaea sp.]
MRTTAAGLRTLWAFSRPHTVIGTAFAVCALYVLATHAAQRQDPALWLLVLAASLAVNVYVVGLNQLTDVEIDRISKPYLPLAAGTLRRGVAVAIVMVSGAGALLLAGLQGRYLFTAIAVIAAIGTGYSVPPVRLKRFPVLAAACIIAARAIVANLGVYLAYSAALTGRAQLPAYVLLMVGFMAGFAAVIALMKDIPDVEGDRRHQVSTLVLTIGPRRTLRLCQAILTAGYAAVIAAGLAGVPDASSLVLIAAHLIALAVLWLTGIRVDGADTDAVRRYYMLIWKLFYAEFVVFPLAVLLA